MYGNAQGIGFAIPIDTAQRVVSELIEHGEISPVWIGLELQDLDPRLLEALGLPPGTLGALVNRVRDTSPAQRAGLRRGDVLTRVDGQPLESARSFYERLDTVTVGQKLELTLQRDGAVQRLTVQAEELPEAFVARLVEELTGLALAPAARGGYQVQSVRSGSGGDRVGLQQGDLVLGINGRALEDESALRRAVLHLRGQSQALLVVQRGAGRYHVALPLL